MKFTGVLKRGEELRKFLTDFLSIESHRGTEVAFEGVNKDEVLVTLTPRGAFVAQLTWSFENGSLFRWGHTPKFQSVT